MRVCGSPVGLDGQRRLHGLVKVRRCAQANLRLHLPRLLKEFVPELEAELRELAHGVPVHLHGRYAYDELANADLHVAVFPMLCFETYGFVLDECFELGLPCIVTDIGALPARAGDAAVLVPPKDEGAMADAMRRFLERPALRDELAERIPDASLSSVEHLERLRSVYDAARARGPRDAKPLPASRRAGLIALQRESAQARITPEGGPR